MKAIRDWSLSTKILLSGLFVLLIVAIPELLLNEYYQQKAYTSTEQRRLARNIHMELLQAMRAERDLRLNDLNTPEFLQQGTVSNLRKYQTSVREIHRYIEELKGSSAQNVVDLNGLQNLVSNYEISFQKYISGARLGTPAEEQMGLLRQMQRATDGAEAMITKEESEALSSASQAMEDFRIAMLLLATITTGLGVLLLYRLARSITKPVTGLQAVVAELGKGNLNAQMNIRSRDEIGNLALSFSNMTSNLLELLKGVQTSGIHVTSSSTHIAAAARQLEATVSEQAASTNQVVATARQIADTSTRLTDTMQEVRTVTDETRLLVETGQTSLIKMETTMQELVAGTKMISSRLSVLREKADKINGVIRTITKVAEQTNLLSLNAAIEAEKAGEAGPGFAVVASEIRRLADQTSLSAREIERMVKEMHNAVNAGVSGVDQFSGKVQKGVEDIEGVGRQLVMIIQQVHTLIPRFEAVGEAMKTQSISAEQINESMLHIHESAQQTAESVRELNQITDRLNQAARSLQTEVSRFRTTA